MTALHDAERVVDGPPEHLHWPRAYDDGVPLWICTECGQLLPVPLVSARLRGVEHVLWLRWEDGTLWARSRQQPDPVPVHRAAQTTERRFAERRVWLDDDE